MQDLFEISRLTIERTRLDFIRSLHDRIDWDNKLIGIKGARGTGKTTLLLQRLKQMTYRHAEKLYLSLDDVYFTTNHLIDVAEAFQRQGGKVLALDEVHKYPGWSREIKNLYDRHPLLQIIFTGSSILEITRREGD